MIQRMEEGFSRGLRRRYLLHLLIVGLPLLVAPVALAGPTTAPTSQPASAPTSQPASAPATIPESAPEEATTSSWGPAIGACAGCGLCGALPDGVAVAGFALFFVFLDAAVQEGGCGGILLVILGTLYGLVPAYVASVVAGPLVPLGVAGGAAIGAVLADRSPWIPLLGALPGLALGTAGSALALLSLFGGELQQTEGEPVSWNPSDELALGLMVGGLAAALAGGPVALIGAVGADLLLGEDACTSCRIEP